MNQWNAGYEVDFSSREAKHFPERMRKLYDVKVVSEDSRFNICKNRRWNVSHRKLHPRLERKSIDDHSETFCSEGFLFWLAVFDGDTMFGIMYSKYLTARGKSIYCWTTTRVVIISEAAVVDCTRIKKGSAWVSEIFRKVWSLENNEIVKRIMNLKYSMKIMLRKSNTNQSQHISRIPKCARCRNHGIIRWKSSEFIEKIF